LKHQELIAIKFEIDKQQVTNKNQVSSFTKQKHWGYELKTSVSKNLRISLSRKRLCRGTIRANSALIKQI